MEKSVKQGDSIIALLFTIVKCKEEQQDIQCETLKCVQSLIYTDNIALVITNKEELKAGTKGANTIKDGGMRKNVKYRSRGSK
jgi:hypothetical protein